MVATDSLIDKKRKATDALIKCCKALNHYKSIISGIFILATDALIGKYETLS